MTQPYGPNVGPPPPPPPPQPKKRLTVPMWAFWLTVVAALFVGCGVGAGIGSAAKDESVAASEPTESTEDAPRPIQGREATSRVEAPEAEPTKTESKTPEPEPEPETVLKTSGNGTKTTKTFSVQGDWDLRYTYDCSGFGMEGVMQVWGDSDLGDIYVNEMGMSGDDVTHQHDGGGEMALKVNSTCDWTIRVVDLP